MKKAFAFDRDGTLEWGNPQGPITKEHLEKMRSLGYLIGGSGGQPSSDQSERWREHRIEPDFTVHKENLPEIRAKFSELTHVGDTQDDVEWAKKAKANFMYPDEFIVWLEKQDNRNL